MRPRMAPPHQQAVEAARDLPGHFASWQVPRAYVQLGAGFDPEGLFDRVLGRVAMATAGLASARPSAAGCPLQMILGQIGETTVLVGHGHRYSYEDASGHEVVLPIAAAALAGIRDVVVVETGMALREDLASGSWLAITDTINAMGACPATGYLELIGEPFLDMTDALSQELNAEIINAAAHVGVGLRLGVYQGTRGPQFDTPAEAAAARRNGADVLGHGVVPEAILAALLGCRTAAVVLVAGAAASYGGRRLRQAAVRDVAGFCSKGLVRALRGVFAPPEGIPGSAVGLA